MELLGFLSQIFIKLGLMLWLPQKDQPYWYAILAATRNIFQLRTVSSACLCWFRAGLVVGVHPLANNHKDGQESSGGSFLQRGKDLWKQIVNLFVNCLQQLSVQDFQVPDGSADTSRRSSEVFSAGDLIICNDRYSRSRKLTSLLWQCDVVLLGFLPDLISQSSGHGL